MAGYVKWLGLCGGWVIAGPIGGIFGFAIGSLFDKISDAGESAPEATARNDFSLCLLVLLAAVMKADGVVKRSELDYVKNYLKKVFGVETAQELVLQLRDILRKDVPLADVCLQIRANMDYHSRLELLHLLYCVAAADGDLCQVEVNVITFIARNMGISDADNISIKATFFRNTQYTTTKDELTAAYEILEISESATDEEVKRAYKKMAVKYHPDKVSYLGEEAQETASQKFKKVNEAYEKIKKARNMK